MVFYTRRVILIIMLATIPYFFFVPDSHKPSQSVGQLFISGLGQLCATIRDVRRHGPIVIFLIASALYRDGLATLKPILVTPLEIFNDVSIILNQVDQN